MSLAKIGIIVGRVLAVVCLFVGLSLASSLLGVRSGGRSPLDQLGFVAFTYLAVFTIGYLFAAVGIWIGSSWGLVVAIGTALVEIIIALTGEASVRLSDIEFFIALTVFVVALALFAIKEVKLFSSLHD